MRPFLYVAAAFVAGLVAITAIVSSSLQILEASRHVGEVPLEVTSDRLPGQPENSE